ncbi:hypothetical protein M9H77_34249 [Catharanthus roseus]|uniref:Uncharacterized protein n=1 Tax=Catharanthus roseus TaxID=4058 RepID=A0ACB9ZKQ5_CATRO|nr:hypothetical protein M9H77_34249 [Catharanthus roseus]
MAVSVPSSLRSSLRRNSMGSSTIKDNEAKVLPNYLRSSVGSCHDLCKYGAKRDLAARIMITVPENLPLSPNKGREPDKSNNLLKRNNLLCSPRSPSTLSLRSPRRVGEKEVQPAAKKMATTAKNPHKIKVKPLQPNGASKRGKNDENNARKQTRTSKASKKSILVPATASVSQKPVVRKVLKEASHLNNIDKTIENELESSTVEEIPEKILFITELNPENQSNFTQGENICDDSLLCQKQTEASSASILEETEDVICIDKEVDQVQYSPPSSPKESIDSRSHEGDHSINSSSSSLISSLLSSTSEEAYCLPRKRREDVYCESDGNANESLKVVLRHQTVEEKKPTEGLFNDVIKETARELAKARKGTVKALVGAFETVISLQDQSLLQQFRTNDLPRIP